jgi:hypothetical protein
MEWLGFALVAAAVVGYVAWRRIALYKHLIQKKDL